MLPMFMFSWNAIGIHWARLSKAPQVEMLVCQEEAQGVIDAIMAFAIVNIALTATLLVGFPGRKGSGWLYPPCCSKIKIWVSP